MPNRPGGGMNKFDKVDRIFVMFQAPLAKFSAVAALLFSALPVSGFLCAPDRAGFTRPFLLARRRLTIS